MLLETLRNAYPKGFYFRDVKRIIEKEYKDPHSFIRLLERRGLIKRERTSRGVYCTWVNGGKWRMAVELLDALVNEVPEHDGKKWEREDIPDKIKREVLERDHYRCRVCGKGSEKRKKRKKASGLVVHHIIPDGPSTPDNLITLCRTCHMYVHRMLNMKGWPYSPFWLASENAQL